MNVRLAAQTLSSSVANAIQFLDVSMKLTQCQNSGPTVNFIRVIDRTFDILDVLMLRDISSLCDPNQKTHGKIT